MDDREEMFKVINELEKYTELDGTEWGETCNMLGQLYIHSSLLSEKLINMIAKEIKDNLEAAQQDASIVEETETYTRKVKYLVWV